MRAYEWKTALILTLATMILMRLVWMDLRSYVVSVSPQNRYALDQPEPCAKSLEQGLAPQFGEHLLPRPGWAHAWAYHSVMKLSCRNGVFSVGGFIRYNQGLLITTVLLLVLLTRIVTRSWIIGLFVAVSLLSRGRLIAALGQIGADQLIGLGLAVWGLTFAHWLRSGSIWVLAFNYACILWLVPLEPGLLFLAGVLPLLLSKPGLALTLPPREDPKKSQGFHDILLAYWPWRELAPARAAARAEARVPSPLGVKPEVEAEAEPGNIFRPLPGGVGRLLEEQPFRRKMWAFALWGFVLIAGEFLFLTLLRNDPILRRGFEWSFSEYGAWLVAWLLPIDRDLGLGLLCMLLSLTLWRRSWVLGLRPLIAVSLAGVFLSSLGSLIGDLLFLPGSAARLWMGPRLLLWWEPLLLALGLLALYDLILEIIPRLSPAREYLGKYLKARQKAG